MATTDIHSPGFGLHRTGQLDLLRDDRARLAAAYRQAAESELMNPYFAADERQARHDHYAEIAAELERRRD